MRQKTSTLVLHAVGFFLAIAGIVTFLHGLTVEMDARAAIHLFLGSMGIAAGGCVFAYSYTHHLKLQIRTITEDFVAGKPPSIPLSAAIPFRVRFH
jgi:uncharacterized membrane protein HdeD (DUF308 family)